MFLRNDKALLTTRIIIIITTVIFALISLIIGIVSAVQIHGAYFLLTVIGWFFCWLRWVIWKLILSYICDVKLIRNKLYGESNDGLNVFLKDNSKQYNTELEHLQQLLNSGVITSEEYENRKKELTEGK